MQTFIKEVAAKKEEAKLAERVKNAEKSFEIK